MTDFDARAETWDDANKVKRAEDVAAAMHHSRVTRCAWTALDQFSIA
jgi:hypothetical protein